MGNLTTQELTKYFEHVKGREKIPYEYWDMVTAVRKSSLKHDVKGLEQLLYSMEKAWCRINPHQQSEMLIAARDRFLILAYSINSSFLTKSLYFLKNSIPQ